MKLILAIIQPSRLEAVKEALANVETIILEWIETAKDLGRPIPEPKGRLAFA